ncbi:MAG: ATP-binding cassette domain-containing protein [Rhodospirillaceae bacterium]|nr:ATP-binding cassette domain-containing protein [Rhodospirillaceae bacterium]
MSAVLKVENLKVHFPIKTGGFLNSTVVPLKAVDGVSFDVGAGECLGVVGESGCGKSTLGRAILQLIKPTDGRVLWLGENLCDLAPEAMRQKRSDLQLVFQDPLSSLNPRLSVAEIIREPLYAADPSISRGEADQRIDEIMSDVGLLPEMRNRYPHEFSGGQCQRIAIARAMVLKPKLIVCDEPVSALDVSIQAQVINLLRKLQREHGLSLIFISHDLSVVRHLCHRVMVLYLGRMMELADRDALFAKPLHPYTQALLSAVPIPDPALERAKEPLILSGDLPSPLHPPSGCVFRTRCPKASPKCIKEVPAVEVLSGGHQIACHHWQD